MGCGQSRNKDNAELRKELSDCKDRKTMVELIYDAIDDKGNGKVKASHLLPKILTIVSV